MTKKQAIKKACRIVGSKKKLADAVGVTRQAVYLWIESQTPAARVRAVEAATGGQVTRYELRPDIYGKGS